MRKLQTLNISGVDSAPPVAQAALPGRSTTTPNTDGAPRRGLLRIEEAATWLGLSKRTMYELLSRGEIQSVQIGRSRRIAFTALERYVERAFEWLWLRTGLDGGDLSLAHVGDVRGRPSAVCPTRGRWPSCWAALALVCLDTRSFDQIQPWAQLLADQSSTTDELSNMLVGYAELARHIFHQHVALERHAVTIADACR